MPVIRLEAYFGRKGTNIYFMVILSQVVQNHAIMKYPNLRFLGKWRKSGGLFELWFLVAGQVSRLTSS